MHVVYLLHIKILLQIWLKNYPIIQQNVHGMLFFTADYKNGAKDFNRKLNLNYYNSSHLVWAHTNLIIDIVPPTLQYTKNLRVFSLSRIPRTSAGWPSSSKVRNCRGFLTDSNMMERSPWTRSRNSQYGPLPFYNSVTDIEKYTQFS